MEEEEEEHADENGKHPDITLDLKNFAKIYSSVILSPGQVVSMTLLNQKGLFRKHIAGYTGKELMLKVAFQCTNIEKVNTMQCPQLKY